MLKRLWCVLGVLTYSACGVFALGILAVMFSGSSRREALAPILEGAVVVMAVNLLVMIIHRNVSRNAPKGNWSDGLVRGGPLAAAAYFLRLGRRES
jgi:hypothetical protein